MWSERQLQFFARGHRHDNRVRRCPYLRRNTRPFGDSFPHRATTLISTYVKDQRAEQQYTHIPLEMHPQFPEEIRLDLKFVSHNESLSREHGPQQGFATGARVLALYVSVAYRESSRFVVDEDIPACSVGWRIAWPYPGYTAQNKRLKNPLGKETTACSLPASIWHPARPLRPPAPQLRGEHPSKPTASESNHQHQMDLLRPQRR